MNESFEQKPEHVEPLIKETQHEVFVVDNLESKKNEINNHPYQEIIKRREEIIETKSKCIDGFAEKLNNENNIKLLIENFLTQASDISKTNKDLFKSLCDAEELQTVIDIVLPIMVNEQPHFNISQFKTHTLEQIVNIEDTDMVLQKQRQVVEDLLRDSDEVLDFVMQAKKYNSSNVYVQDNIKAKYIDSAESNHDENLDVEIGILERRSKTLFDTFESYSGSIQLLDEKIAECEAETKRYESQTQNTTVETFVKTLQGKLNELSQNRNKNALEFNNAQEKRDVLLREIDKLQKEKYSSLELDFENKKRESEELQKKSQEYEMQEKIKNIEEGLLVLLNKDLLKGII